MNVTLNKTDMVNAIITIEVKKNDYAGNVENSLKDLRKTAVVPGFRTGMAPLSFISQKYGKSILVEKLNDLVSQALSDYIKDNSLPIFGEPLPSEKQAQIDFDKQEDFTFSFDIGLAPEIEDIPLTKDDKLPYYLIQVSNEILDNQIELIKSEYGNRDSVEDVEDNDIVKGSIIELDENGEPKADGINAEDAIFLPKYMKNEEEKAKFIKAKLHSTLIFNPSKAYEDDEVELASFLDIKKEEVKNHTGDFSFVITEILRFKPAELNQELFDKVFTPGTVNSEEIFREEVKKKIEYQLSLESNSMLVLDMRKLLEEKASSLQLPDAFIKRWMLVADPKLTPESVEDEYANNFNLLKSHLANEYLLKKNNIKVDESEIQEYAKQLTRAQFMESGLRGITDDIVEKYSQELLNKEDIHRSLKNRIGENKLKDAVKNQVTLEPKEITIDEFHEIINQIKK